MGLVGHEPLNRPPSVTDQVRVIEYVDVTNDPDDRVDYPEIVRVFLDLGFEQVGRVLARPVDGTFEEMAAGYGYLADEALEHMTVPTPVLRSPDGTAFAEVSWFFGSPSVRIRTRLRDGSMAETLRRWDNPPPVISEMAEFWKAIDIDRQMSRAHNPMGGRSILVVPDATATILWGEHRRHVWEYASARSTEPGRHETLDDHLAMVRAGFDHALRTEDTTAGWWVPLMYAYTAVWMMVVAALTVFGFRALFVDGELSTFLKLVGSAVGLAVMLALTGHRVFKLIVSRVRSTPMRLRPTFPSRPTDTDEGDGGLRT